MDEMTAAEYRALLAPGASTRARGASKGPRAGAGKGRAQKGAQRGSEHAEQAALIAMCALHEARYPALRLLYAVPNGGARDAVTGARMKAEGQRKGVLDLHLPCPRKGHTGLWLEMKYGRNKPSPEQEWWMERLTEEGHRVVVCYSAEAALAELLDYLEAV